MPSSVSTKTKVKAPLVDREGNVQPAGGRPRLRYHGRMPLNRTSREVDDTKYHLVWAPKYRRWIIREDIRRRLEQVFCEIAEDFGFELVELEE